MTKTQFDRMMAEGLEQAKADYFRMPASFNRSRSSAEGKCFGMWLQMRFQESSGFS